MDDENELINQDEIEQLLHQSLPPGGSSAEGPRPEPPVVPRTAGGEPPSGAGEEGGASGQPGAGAAAVPAQEPTDRPFGQGDIDRLLSQAGIGATPPVKPPATNPGPQTPHPRADSGIAQSDLESLLHRAEEALASLDENSAESAPAGVTPFRFENLAGTAASTESATLDLIRDVELDLKIELGRTQMYLEDVLKLRRGSVVTLDKLAGDPVDIFVNGRLIARGEVLVLNDNFCVRVAELVAGVNPQ
jgi:flagellar motor switch protein FliN/FliY